MNRYTGTRNCGAIDVRVDGVPLNPRFDLRLHSPNGFEWGYGGSGPAQLALAILANHFGDDEWALNLYQRFKWAVIAQLPWKEWTLTSVEIDHILQTIRHKAELQEGKT